jgi:chitinase
MRRATLVGVVLTALLAGVAGVQHSGADFTAASSAQGSTFAAAADFNSVAVALDDPGAAVSGTVDLTAHASSDRGITDVRFEVSPAGANNWMQMCVDAAAPYTCSGDSALMPDGSYDIRVTATDSAGYWRRATRTGIIDNTDPSASLANPGSFVTTGTVLTATGGDALSGLASLAVQYRPASGGSWSDACTGSTSPRACVLPALADGDVELRARAEDAAGNVTTSASIVRRLDRTAPSVAVNDPGAMRGNFGLTVTAGDGAGTGVTSVRYQYRLGAGAWTDICPTTTAPFGCSWNTTAVADGLYDLRAIATDGAGFTTTSAVLASRRVDNTVPSVPTIADPGSPRRATIDFTGTATDGGSGIASWTVQYRPNGSTGAWTDACSGTSSPYTCSWASTAVADGSYEFRAVATDAAGNTRNSATRSARVIDNTGPTATDVQAVNGGSTTGRMQANDYVRFTWSEAIAPASVLSGWAGGSQAVAVRVIDGGGADSIDFYDTANTTRLNLGAVALNANFVGSAGAVWNATMTRSGTQITITLNSIRSGAVNTTQAAFATMSWQPSGSALDAAGNPAGTTARSETGAFDRDF